MSGRRSHQRFAISTPIDGALYVLRDVLVERASGDEFVAVSRHAGIVGETLRMEWADVPEGLLSVQVRDSRPTVSDGAMRHRLFLSRAGSLPGSGMAAFESATASIPIPMLAVLTREMPVRVMNCSSSGCLLESAVPIEVGTVASLRLVLRQEELVDHVQVVRCRPIEGGSSYHAGAEFLWTVAPTRLSLRTGIGYQPHAAERSGFSGQM